ncbi:AMP-binding protein [Streptomyces sulphureus]|uniref:AMP-binding protein n=1 Tax=Streptomyces sulphureus TaxID=47758 RepID=UPI00036E26DE|nr:AMP-binding protein [Streptomyces sulphureus]
MIPQQSQTQQPTPVTPDHWATRSPDRPAVIVPDGQVLTYRQLVDASVDLARTWRGLGLLPGDRVALVMENRVEYPIVAIAALRSAARLVPVGSHLTDAEMAHVLAHADARVVVTSSRLRPTVERALAECPAVEAVLVAGAGSGRFTLARGGKGSPSAEPPDDVGQGSAQGDFMFYSSGTTGAPKGILRPLPAVTFAEGDPLTRGFREAWDFTPESVWLNTAPLYHAFPLQVCSSVLRWGGTLVLTERFEAADFLDLLATYRVTHLNLVPTMFVRLLRLPAELRQHADTSTVRYAVHAGAPCPVEVKREMMRWWGPVLYEFYGGSENIGMVLITPQEWLAHPGSVGRPQPGTVTVLDEEHRPVPPYTRGGVWFEGARRFSYHKAAEKTADVSDDEGRATLGDIGYLDEDGYLYLDGRRTDLIVSGGVNIYPAEVENRLSAHPAVFDVGVIGVPDEEFGQQVRAVVQLEEGETPTPRLAEELLAFCRERLAGFKCPRSLVFEAELPRTSAGKLLKRVLVEQALR